VRGGDGHEIDSSTASSYARVEYGSSRGPSSLVKPTSALGSESLRHWAGEWGVSSSSTARFGSYLEGGAIS
jgi:hypothetical protein